MAGYMVGGVDAPDMVAPVLPYIMEIYEKVHTRHRLDT